MSVKNREYRIIDLIDPFENIIESSIPELVVRTVSNL